jgi:hypothetical protein
VKAMRKAGERDRESVGHQYILFTLLLSFCTTMQTFLWHQRVFFTDWPCFIAATVYTSKFVCVYFVKTYV